MAPAAADLDNHLQESRDGRIADSERQTSAPGREKVGRRKRAREMVHRESTFSTCKRIARVKDPR